MKNYAKFILCAILLLLAVSLILDAFADDDHYRKRHRYRGGPQKLMIIMMIMIVRNI